MTKRISVLLVVLLILFTATMFSSCNKQKKQEEPVAVEEKSVAESVETPAEKTPEPEPEQTPAASEPEVVAEPETVEEPVAEAEPEAAAEQPSEEETLKMPETLAEKFSYAFGCYLASTYGDEMAMQYFYMYKQYYWPEMDEYFGAFGVYSFMQGALLYSVDEINALLAEYPEEYAARMQEKAKENLAIAEDFLAENAKREGVYTTESGLQYEIVKQGTGEYATASDSVELDYELTLLNGDVIDSSYARGQHSTFAMSGVIAGFSEGVMLMPMGSHYIFYIHPSLGYGEQATGGMEPNSLLVFNVETYSVVK